MLLWLLLGGLYFREGHKIVKRGLTIKTIQGDVMELMAQELSGISHLHGLEIIHADLSMANVAMDRPRDDTED